jgi:nucleotide-binding universal stress UspA family protein
MALRKPILALSDLSLQSDAAVRFAGILAHALGADLNVLHAMGLTYRPMRAVMPALSDIHDTLQSIDATLRAQIRRVVPQLVATNPPLVDMDRPAEALRRHAKALNPMVVITPNLWDWSTSRFTFAGLAHPLLIIREPRRQTYDQVLIVSTHETFGDEMVEAAGRWGFWLEHAYNCPGAAGGPDFEVVTLDDDGSTRKLERRIADPQIDLIAIDKAIFGINRLKPRLDALMPAILEQTVAPITVLPHAGSATRMEDDPRLVTIPRLERLEA